MTGPVDFVLESPSTNSMLLVEAKSTNAPSPEWAARFARNLTASSEWSATNLYFLLVLRNYLFLWNRLPRESTDAPDFSAKTEEVLKPYLVSLHTSLKDINAPNFELLVRTWLSDLSEGTAPESVEQWLRTVGLQRFENSVMHEDRP
jgi:hypothetical protein